MRKILWKEKNCTPQEYNGENYAKNRQFNQGNFLPNHQNHYLYKNYIMNILFLSLLTPLQVKLLRTTAFRDPVCLSQMGGIQCAIHIEWPQS